MPYSSLPLRFPECPALRALCRGSGSDLRQGHNGGRAAVLAGGFNFGLKLPRQRVDQGQAETGAALYCLRRYADTIVAHDQTFASVLALKDNMDLAGSAIGKGVFEGIGDQFAGQQSQWCRRIEI